MPSDGVCGAGYPSASAIIVIDLEVLPHFDRSDEFGRIEQCFVGTGIELGIDAPESLGRQEPSPEIDVVDIGDFEAPTRRVLNRGRDLDNRSIVKMEPMSRPALRRRSRLSHGLYRPRACSDGTWQR